MNATKDLDIRLKNARVKKGLSQIDVANELNISRQAVSRWENGKSIPDADNLALLSQLYGVSLDKLLNCAFPNKTEGKNEDENQDSDLSTSQNDPAPEPAPDLSTSQSEPVPESAPHTPPHIISSFNKEYVFLILLLTFSCLSCWIGIIVSICLYLDMAEPKKL